ncbi:unnamed protein product [Dracunculus medinensis]|uniref:Plasminogen receptor (KT) n=1 Tax=Dracunculus medinensis TaxID=318479 RepID=A0A0N4UFQ5_DRAME|nr:unnamed protein product [Dracunculus medinensis]
MGNQASIEKGEEAEIKEFYRRQMQNEIALRNLWFEKKRAFKLAALRESFSWEAVAAATVVLSLTYFASVHKNRLISVGIPPIVMAIGYRYDMCFGNLEKNIRCSQIY